MSDLQAFDYGYQVGGTIAADSPVYVERLADSELLATLESGKFCYVFNSRQMGKSSLRVRTQAKLLDRGWACASIDLTNVISDGISESQFYNGLIAELTEALDLDFQRKAWLAAQDDLSPVQQFGNFVAQVVLGQISQPIAIFIDEIDSTLRLNFSIDPFFARIRSFYNQRSEQPEFQRLTFCLVGVAAPSQLIRDRTQTPFNIGEAIELSGLPLVAALGPLGDRLPGTAAEREQTLREILDWTGGQPFLTQRLCALVRDNEGEPVAALVQREIVERWQFDDPQEHFKARRDRLLEAKSANLGRRLGCYQRVLASADGLELDSSEEQLELRLVGLVRSQGGRLRVYNQIYGAVFDSAWVAAELAKLRPYEEQLQAWLKSGEDQKYLLRGKALRSALQFRRGKRLATEDEDFLLASTTAAGQRQLRWAGIGSGVLIAVTAGAAWFGVKQVEREIERANAISRSISQLEQSSRAAMNRFETSQLESLVQGTRTLKKLKNLEGSKNSFGELAATGPVDALANTLAQILEKNQLQGHSSWVNSVSWSPDGKTLATGSADKTVKLWNAASGQMIATLRGHRGWVLSVSWSPDGKTLATGSADDTVKLWNVTSGQMIATLQGHSNPVRSVSWSPDGKTLATGSADDTVKLWNVTSGRAIATLRGHRNWVNSVSWSPDGKTLATGSADDTVKLWNVTSGQTIATLRGHRGWVNSVSWSPNGKTLTTGSSDDTVKLWNVTSGQAIATLQEHSNSVWSMSWSVDGETLATGRNDGTIKLWNVTSGQAIAILQGHRDRVNSVSWSPDGKTLATGSDDGTIKLWNVTSGQAITMKRYGRILESITWNLTDNTLTIDGGDSTVKLWSVASSQAITTLQGHSDDVNRVSWSPDSKTLVTINPDKTVMWNVAIGEEIATLQRSSHRLDHRVWVSSVSWSPDGKTLATISSDDTVKLWNAAAGEAIDTLTWHSGDVNSVDWSPDGKTLAISSSDKTVTLWDVASGQATATLRGHSDDVDRVSWSPDGKTLTTGSSDGIVTLWDVASGQATATLRGHSDDVDRVSWSPDGKTLATIDSDKTVKLWNVASGQAIATLQERRVLAWSVSWSPDGKTLATIDSDKTVKLWNVASGQAIATLQGHSGSISSVSWSPDGKTLATGSEDKTVKLWNVASREAIATLQGHSGVVFSVSWSPDGKTLATGSNDGTVKLWPMTIEGLLDKACAYLKPYLTNPDHPERNTPKVCDYPPSP